MKKGYINVNRMWIMHSDVTFPTCITLYTFLQGRIQGHNVSYTCSSTYSLLFFHNFYSAFLALWFISWFALYLWLVEMNVYYYDPISFYLFNYIYIASITNILIRSLMVLCIIFCYLLMIEFICCLCPYYFLGSPNRTWQMEYNFF